MANNRVWLVHTPSGEKVLLGKRVAWGWYTNDTPEETGVRLQAFFDSTQGSCERNSDQDAFELEFEHGQTGD